LPIGITTTVPRTAVGSSDRCRRIATNDACTSSPSRAAITHTVGPGSPWTIVYGTSIADPPGISPSRSMPVARAGAPPASSPSRSVSDTTGTIATSRLNLPPAWTV
jgi:hypothetical protein